MLLHGRTSRGSRNSPPACIHIDSTGRGPPNSTRCVALVVMYSTLPINLSIRSSGIQWSQSTLHNKRHITCYVCMHGGHSLRSDPRGSHLVNTQQLWQERKMIYHFQKIMTLHFQTGHVHRHWKMAPKPQALSNPSPLEINARGTLTRCLRGVRGSSYRGQLTKRPL